MKQTYFQLQIYYKTLKNHTTKANFCWKSLKKAMHGTQSLEDSKCGLHCLNEEAVVRVLFPFGQQHVDKLRDRIEGEAMQ